MISANERGERKRLRLAKAEFDEAKRAIEHSARTNYPELQQSEIIASSTKEKQERRQTRESRKAQEMKKRGARLTKTEALAQELRAILAYASSQIELERLLKEKGFTFYERGKHCGVKPIANEGDAKKRKAHRFATLGIEAEHAAFLERVEPVIEDAREEDRVEGEKEKHDDVEAALHADSKDASELDGQKTDNESYVNKDGNADLNLDFSSQKNPNVDPSTEDPFLREMEERRAKRDELARIREQSRKPKGRSR